MGVSLDKNFKVLKFLCILGITNIINKAGQAQELCYTYAVVNKGLDVCRPRGLKNILRGFFLPLFAKIFPLIIKERAGSRH